MITKERQYKNILYRDSNSIKSYLLEDFFTLFENYEQWSMSSDKQIQN